MAEIPHRLTEQQQKVLAFVADFLHQRGFPPTLREIGQAMGLANVNAVRGHLSALEKKGYIRKDPDKARSIRLIRAPSAFSQIKRRLHEVFRTDEGVIPHLVYGLAWVTWRRRPILTDRTRERVAAAIDQEVAEHGWTLRDRRIDPDCVRIVVETWPNHSPQQTVRRFWAACNLSRILHSQDFPKHRLWAKGYIATTDVGLLDELVEAFQARQDMQEADKE